MLAQVGTPAFYPAGATIFQQTERADGVYYVKEGLVKIDVSSRQGKRAVIALHGPDSFFGEACLAGQVSHTANAVALLETRLVHVRKPSMLHLLRSDPDFAQQFTTHVVQRAVRVEEDVIDLLFNSTRKRLARTLLLLAGTESDGDSQPVLDHITHKTLAEIVGTTRPRISQFLGEFRQRGFISARGPLRVHSSLAKAMLED
jgi:CRP/FNR family cyclic AMP-dependent transcriptional regulator